MLTVLSKTYEAFFHSEKAGGLLLFLCTALALVVANTALGAPISALWNFDAGGLSLRHWINDGLMAVFFLLVGLELKREISSGELSGLRQAALPLFAAAGGVAVPALIHLALNAGTSSQAGAGIPMATDIAFALGVLALLGSRIPASLKIFLTALAVVDDLAAIIVIAVFYTASPSLAYLLGAVAVFALLCVLNRAGRIRALWPYLLGGSVMWFLFLRSGVHPTLAGVLLAFAIPYSAQAEDETSPSHRLESVLHRPVAFLVLPLFALANTGIVLSGEWQDALLGSNSLGIALGLVIGKPVGILLLSFAGVAIGACRLPDDLTWAHIAGAGMLGGIGFTMSIFIANLAFVGDAQINDSSTLAVLVASLLSGILGYAWLRRVAGKQSP